VLISAFDYRWYVGAIAVTGIVWPPSTCSGPAEDVAGPNPDGLQVDVDAGGDSRDLGRREPVCWRHDVALVCSASPGAAARA
jgi:hypothetical protein